VLLYGKLAPKAGHAYLNWVGAFLKCLKSGSGDPCDCEDRAMTMSKSARIPEEKSGTHLWF
jgi:hypothetical protein